MGALGPVALGALGQPALGRDRALELGAPLGAGPLVGRLAALLDQPACVPLRFGGLVAGAGGHAGSAVRLVAGGVRVGDGRGRRLDLGERRLLGPRRGLDLSEQRFSPVPLGEHAILAAGGDLP